MKKNTPYRKAKTIRQVLRVLDNELAEIVPESISCNRCSEPHCCSRFVGVSALEARALVAEANRVGFEIDEHRAMDQTEFCESPGATATSYAEMESPCIFLVEGRCAVYAARPVACRGHYVMSPPETCDRLHADKPVKLGDTMPYTTDAYKAVRFVHFNKGIRPTVGALPAMVLRELGQRPRQKEGGVVSHEGVTADAVPLIVPRTKSTCQTSPAKD